MKVWEYFCCMHLFLKHLWDFLPWKLWWLSVHAGASSFNKNFDQGWYTWQFLDNIYNFLKLLQKSSVSGQLYIRLDSFLAFMSAIWKGLEINISIMYQNFTRFCSPICQHNVFSCLLSSDWANVHAIMNGPGNSEATCIWSQRQQYSEHIRNLLHININISIMLTLKPFHSPKTDSSESEVLPKETKVNSLQQVTGLMENKFLETVEVFLRYVNSCWDAMITEAKCFCQNF